MDKKVKVEVCTGTACFVMGGSDLLLLGESLPEDLQGKVEVEGTNCLGFCKDGSKSKAPYIILDGEKVEDATYSGVLGKIREILNA